MQKIHTTGELPKPNTEAFERDIVIAQSGFREYDARWQYPEQLNLNGVKAMGMALGTLIHEQKVEPKIAVGHDYRSYSVSIKNALIVGLMAAGCEVHDIGLALSPVAYFSQFELDCPAVAMVTASHNNNGWTGIKMGMERPMTFGPELMGRLKEIATQGEWKTQAGGAYHMVEDIKKPYLADLIKDGDISRPLKVVAACGNGTAGVYAPEALRAIGCEVVELDCELDYTFPRYNPNPEDMKMLHQLAKAVKEHKADVGFGFDGDGDRCGVVDNEGEEIFADKVGVMLARDLAATYENKQFVVDVKSTGLYNSDPVLQEVGAQTDYWKTGHSYIKRRVNELGALVGFEKSGHYFYNEPIGRGYDDGVLSAISVCRMLDRAPQSTMADLKNSLPKTWSSPTMSPQCADDKKYGVVDNVIAHFENLFKSKTQFIGQDIIDIVTINGVRFTLEDGTWGLIRASSNTPNLVVVVESPVSEDQMHKIFNEINGVLANYPEVGEYDQKLEKAA
jgi:phosphomannomutase/phosphoglucomutase